MVWISIPLGLPSKYTHGDKKVLLWPQIDISIITGIAKRIIEKFNYKSLNRD